MRGNHGPGESHEELYKAVRAHEVMLNQATSAFEHAVIARLAALNGGAAGAFLTLLGVLLKSNGKQPLNVPFAAGAVVTWAAGLVAASAAAWYGLRQQRATNKGYRIMREGIEHQIWPDIAPFIPPPDDAPEESVQEEHDDADRRLAQRRTLRAEAMKNGAMFNRMFPISVACFVLGAVFSLVAVVA